MSANELWYHMSAKAKLYHDLRQPLDKEVLEWASSEVEKAEALFFLDNASYCALPLLKLVCAYGIHYGIHGQLETFYLATDKVTHENIAHIAKRMCAVLSMRDYIDRHWVELITEGITQESPRIRRGAYAVGCAFTTLGSYVPGITSNKITADLYSPDHDKTRPFMDVHPFNFVIDISSDEDSEGATPVPKLRRRSHTHMRSSSSFSPSLVSASEPY